MTEPVPEEFVSDPEVAQPMGYAESKYVGEAILHSAAHSCRVRTSLLRGGQVAGAGGSSTALWNENEWVPTLVQTSKALDTAPNELPPVNWIPVDTLAGVVSEIAASSPEDSPELYRVFNIINPSALSWTMLLPSVEEALGGSLERVSLARWVEGLRKVDDKGVHVMARQPAIKILPFFESLGAQTLEYETERTIR